MSIRMITGFAQYLRDNEMEVPVSAVEEAVKLQPFLATEDKETFQNSMKQLFIKDSSHFEKYKLYFEEYFYKTYESKRRQEIREGLNEEFGSTINSFGKYSLDGDLEWLVNHLTEGDFGEKIKIAKMFLEELTSSKDYDFEKTIRRYKKTPAEDIVNFGESLVWKAMLAEQTEEIFDAIGKVTDNLLMELKATDKFKTEKLTELSGIEKTVHTGLRRMITTAEDELKETSIYKLNKTQVQTVRDGIERNAAHLISKFSKILKDNNNEHEIDMQATIQASLKTFGVPMEILYRSRKKKKTKIDIILDVSGSVVKAAEVLILFAHIINRRFPGQVRVFAFVGMLKEVTEYFNTADVDYTVNKILKSAMIDYRGYSNYGMAFEIYRDLYMKDVDKDTLVYILGDARNNANHSRKEVIEEIRNRSPYVFWFNPENKGLWNSGDSVIEKYANHCTKVSEVNTVNKLLLGLEETAKYVSDNIA